MAGTPDALTPEQTERMLAFYRRRARALATAAPIADVVLALCVCVPSIGGVVSGAIGGSLGWAIPLSVAAGAAVMVRRRLPLTALIAATVVFVIAAFAQQLVGPLLVAILICMFSYAARHDPKATIIAACSTGAASFAVVVGLMHPWSDPGALIFLALIALAAALGNGSRITRLLVYSMAQRARDAEATREEEARHRVSEERVRIARELHDLVGHHVAVISIQSNVALQSLRSDPAIAESALHEVRTAARDVLKETATAIQVLRSADEADGIEATTPGLADLPALIDSLRAGGAHIALHVTGQQDLDPVTDLTAYRIVQEALTNAVKHGTQPVADITIRHGPGTLLLEITNPAEGDAHNGQGYGLAGMRERVNAIGGTLHTRRGHGRFTVHAELPARRRKVDME